MTGYQTFSMKDVLQRIREKIKEEIEDIELEKEENIDDDELQRQKGILSYICNISDNTSVEELPIYRDYLSKFTLRPFFRDKPLLTEFDDMLSKADGYLLLKLVCGSFSSNYHITYNEEKGGLDLTIHVESNGQSITKKSDELLFFHFDRLFEIYLNEMLTIEYYLKNNIDKDEIKEAMEIQLVIFEQKMRALEEKHRQALTNNEDIDAELDRLLDS